jgi:hypothetical protein
MKKLAVVMLLGLGLLCGRLSREVRVKAQDGCSLQSLAVPYTYALSGSYFDSLGRAYGFSSAGRFVPDGNGNFTGVDTNSDGALVTRGRKYFGDYTVNATDCTGSAVFKDTGGRPFANVDLIITNNGKNLNFIQSDLGTNIAGTAQQQFPAQ